MSVHVIGSAYRNSCASSATLFVLVTLADEAHDDGVTWISEARIAEKMRLSERQVRRYIRELEDLGELETRKAQVGRKRINVYRLLLPGLRPISYERLPFNLVEPFSDDRTQTSGGREADDRTDTVVTTGQIEQPSRARALTPKPKPSDPSRTRVAPSESARPRNEPFDVLAEECQADPRTRGGEIAKALKAIRSLYAEDSPHDPDTFDQRLAAEIRERAATYRRKFPKATLTPSALQKWWLDIERVNAGGGHGVSVEQILREGREAHSRGR